MTEKPYDPTLWRITWDDEETGGVLLDGEGAEVSRAMDITNMTTGEFAAWVAEALVLRVSEESGYSGSDIRSELDKAAELLADAAAKVAV